MSLRTTNLKDLFAKTKEIADKRKAVAKRAKPRKAQWENVEYLLIVFKTSCSCGQTFEVPNEDILLGQRQVGTTTKIWKTFKNNAMTHWPDYLRLPLRIKYDESRVDVCHHCANPTTVTTQALPKMLPAPKVVPAELAPVPILDTEDEEQERLEKPIDPITIQEDAPYEPEQGTAAQ